MMSKERDIRMNIKKALKRSVMVLLGSFIMGIGIYLTIVGNIGSDPLTMLWIGIAEKLTITVGQANLLVSAVMLVIVFFIDRKELFVGSLLNPLVIALTTDFLTQFSFSIDSKVMQILIFISGLLVMALGIALYSLAGFGRGAYEALVFSLSNIFKLSIRVVRTSFDILFTLIGFLLGVGISFAPFLAIVFMGILIQFFIQKLLRPTAEFLGE